MERAIQLMQKAITTNQKVKNINSTFVHRTYWSIKNERNRLQADVAVLTETKEKDKRGTYQYIWSGIDKVRGIKQEFKCWLKIKGHVRSNTGEK